MSMLSTFASDEYSDGRTKQSFKDDTDINKLLARAARGDSISHLAKHGAMYGDFSDIDDLLTANARLEKGTEIFNSLPGEIRREFKNSPSNFFNYVNDPQNSERLGELLPALTAPGNQLRTIVRTPSTVPADPPQGPPEGQPEAPTPHPEP